MTIIESTAERDELGDCAKPRIVATYDELYALRAGVELHDKGGVVMQLQVPDDRGPYGYWAIAGVQGDFPYSSVTLPATVLHESQL